MYEEQRKRNWANVAACYVVSGVILGLLFVGLFVRAPHWLTGLLAVAFGYGGGYLGVKAYERIHCSASTR